MNTPVALLPRQLFQALSATRAYPWQTALAIGALLTVAGWAVLFSQNPTLHDTFHEVRHGVGVKCH
ncbi:MAG: CbtB-domain containing protein [Deltaproteobacteria bacterium]|nr:CbtB-domain containing protein [Deltaproteobacteria bacterium]